jgi:hypothetical protein
VLGLGRGGKQKLLAIGAYPTLGDAAITEIGAPTVLKFLR